MVGNTKNMRGAKKAKDMLTVGIFWDATGKNFWQPIFIGKSKNPRCFGKHWKVSSLGAQYYNNSKAWMDSTIWWEVNRKFNRQVPPSHMLVPIAHCQDGTNCVYAPQVLLRHEQWRE